MIWRKIRRALAWWLFAEFPAFEKERQRQEHAQLRRKLKQCGKDVFFYGNVHVSGTKHAVLGDNVHIGNQAFIRAEGGLFIGDHTHISRNFLLYTMSHRTDDERVPYDEGWVKKPVHIGANVWIGMNVTVVPGTRIGDGAIIGMGTVVSGEVPPHVVVVGSKWRIVGQRDTVHYDECVANGLFGAVDGIPYDPETEETE